VGLLRHLATELLGDGLTPELPGDPIEPLVLADRIAQLVRARGREDELLRRLTAIDNQIALETSEWSGPRLLGSKYAFFAEACAQLANTQSFRATFVGPVFLFPQWVVDRRNLQRQTPNFSVAVRRYLEEGRTKVGITSRIILRNSNAFLKDYQSLVRPDERNKFINDMLNEVTALYGQRGDEGPQTRCADTGYIYLPHVFEHAVLIATRTGPMAQVDGGWIDTTTEAIRRERDRFDKVYDGVQQTQEEAIEQLRRFIRAFWKA
jgi:hypothetical protein